MTFDTYVAKLAERRRRSSRSGSGRGASAARASSCGSPRSASVELLSTHDQLLGGPSGQSYLGCVFPADPAYAARSPRDAAKVGDGWPRGRPGAVRDRLRRRPDDRRHGTPYAIELNLRKGGTTHPFLTLQFLTDGRVRRRDRRRSWRPAAAEVPRRHRSPRVAAARGLTHDDLFDIIVRHGLHFDQARQTGVVFHMMSCAGRARPRRADRASATIPTRPRRCTEHAEAALLEEARYARSPRSACPDRRRCRAWRRSAADGPASPLIGRSYIPGAVRRRPFFIGLSSGFHLR